MTTSTTPPPAGVSRVVRDPAIQGHAHDGALRRAGGAGAGGLEGVLYDFPHLSAEDVADALAYYQRYRAELAPLLRELGDGDA